MSGRKNFVTAFYTTDCIISSWYQTFHVVVLKQKRLRWCIVQTLNVYWNKKNALCIYIYIYIYRERERRDESDNALSTWLWFWHIKPNISSWQTDRLSRPSQCLSVAAIVTWVHDVIELDTSCVWGGGVNSELSIGVFSPWAFFRLCFRSLPRSAGGQNSSWRCEDDQMCAANITTSAHATYD